MLDAHIHIEKGPYTLEWINEFVRTAVHKGINEIWLLEHCYRFIEFVPMYDEVCSYSEYIDKWFHRKAGALCIDDYLNLIKQVRKESYPVKICFGLEVCYFKEHEAIIREYTSNNNFDFIVGSVHFIDRFAFDHKVEHWTGRDVDNLYRRYFEISIELAESKLFDGIAHPDSIKLFGHSPSFSLLTYYDKLAEAVAKSDMYAEQSGGIHRRTKAEIGMNIDLLSAMKRHGVKIITASDAHYPEDVGLYIKEAGDLCI